MTRLEYVKAYCERQAIIRQNLSRRINGLPRLSVPDKPMPPMGWELQYDDRSYAGFTTNEEEAAAWQGPKVRKESIR